MGIGINLYPVLVPLVAVDAPIITNTIVESSIFPLVNGVPGLATLPAGEFNEGSTLGLEIGGKFSNKAAGPGTITLRAFLGGTPVWSSGALQFPSVIHTDATFKIDLDLMRRPGSKVMGVGELRSVLGLFLLPATNPTDSAAIDFTQDLDLDIRVQFSVADPGNKFQMLSNQCVY